MATACAAAGVAMAAAFSGAAMATVVAMAAAVSGIDFLRIFQVWVIIR
jgi:hypothetical protein